MRVSPRSTGRERHALEPAPDHIVYERLRILQEAVEMQQQVIAMLGMLLLNHFNPDARPLSDEMRAKTEQMLQRYVRTTLRVYREMSETDEP